MQYAVIKTPIGFFRIEEENNMITKISYLEKLEDVIEGKTETLKLAIKEINDYFNGSLKKFTFPINPKGSEFYKKVWSELFKLEYAKTISYKELAKLAGNEKASRAVGSAMRSNPIVIAIPCHRVLKASGELGNYSAGGPSNKDWLLTFENQNL